MSLEVGQTAPDFELLDDAGKKVSLSDYRGKKVVLFFYPKADTPGCTVESCDFRDEVKAFSKKGTVVLGASKDTPKDQTKFKEKYSLPFTLLCDTETKVMQGYGVWQEKNMYGKKVMGCVRTTFVIDEKGKIAQIYPKVKVEGHAQAVLESL